MRVRLETNVEGVRRWYPMGLETMRPHVVPPRRLRFFLALFEELVLLGLAQLLVAEGARG